jgi:hypothetical protein
MWLRELVTEVLINPIIRTRTHHFRRAYPSTRDTMFTGADYWIILWARRNRVQNLCPVPWHSFIAEIPIALNNSLELSPWESTSPSATQEFSNILCDPPNPSVTWGRAISWWKWTHLTRMLISIQEQTKFELICLTFRSKHNLIKNYFKYNLYTYLNRNLLLHLIACMVNDFVEKCLSLV